MKFDTCNFTIGDYFLSALINGDASGLREHEAAALAEFERSTVERFGAGHWATTEETNEFGRCEITDLMGRVELVQYVFQIPA